MEPPHLRRPTKGVAVVTRNRTVRWRVVFDFDEAGNPLQGFAERYVGGERVAFSGFIPEPFDTARSLPAAAVLALDRVMVQGALFE